MLLTPRYKSSRKIVEEGDADLTIIYAKFFDTEETFDGGFIYIFNEESCRKIFNTIKKTVKN